MTKTRIINVSGTDITVFHSQKDDFISLTDMARFKNFETTWLVISHWMRTRNAIEFCGLWEQMNNPGFKSIEFDAFKNEAGLNSFTLTPQRWIGGNQCDRFNFKIRTLWRNICA